MIENVMVGTQAPKDLSGREFVPSSVARSSSPELLKSLPTRRSAPATDEVRRAKPALFRRLSPDQSHEKIRLAWNNPPEVRDPRPFSPMSLKFKFEPTSGT